MQQFRLIGMSAMLAALVWVVADQSLTATATLQIEIDPFSTGGDLWVSAINDSGKPYEIQVTGKKATITSLKAREPLTVRFPVEERTPGEYVLGLLDQLVSFESGDLAGIIVQDVTPPSLAVRIDRDKIVTLPIHVQRGALNYEVPPVVEPTEVEVTISQLAYDALPREERRIVLFPDDYVRTASRGELQTKPVPLTSMVGNVPVQLDPDFVNLRFKLAEQLQEKTISAVPIKIESSLAIFNRYDVDVVDAGAVLTRPVTIRGRSEVVGQIGTAGEIAFWGTISLTAADKADPGTYRYHTPRFNLPTGVELVGQVDPVELRLVPRPRSE